LWESSIVKTQALALLAWALVVEGIGDVVVVVHTGFEADTDSEVDTGSEVEAVNTGSVVVVSFVAHIDTWDMRWFRWALESADIAHSCCRQDSIPAAARFPLYLGLADLVPRDIHSAVLAAESVVPVSLVGSTKVLVIHVVLMSLKRPTASVATCSCSSGCPNCSASLASHSFPHPNAVLAFSSPPSSYRS
jgi:hypothetical protein